MELTKDIHVEIAKIQNEIKEYLGMNNENLIFEFLAKENNTQLDLVTVNSRHNQSFLFHSVIGYDKVDCLNKMLGYVKNYRDKENSYTLQWKAKGDDELHTSYFQARNIYEALDKLYYGREVNSIIVFNVVLNPVS